MQFTMKFYVFTIVSLIITQIAFAQISFKDIPIGWKDFTPAQKITTHANGTASIHVNTAYQWESATKNKLAYINFKSTVETSRDKNFVQEKFLRTAPATEKAQLLRHEQGHYIIALIKNLWLKETLNSYTFTRNFKSELREVYKQVEARADKLNAAYDSETNHSLNREQQEVWEQKLLDMLNGLNQNSRKLPVKVELQIEVNM